MKQKQLRLIIAAFCGTGATVLVAVKGWVLAMLGPSGPARGSAPGCAALDRHLRAAAIREVLGRRALPFAPLRKFNPPPAGLNQGLCRFFRKLLVVQSGEL